MFFLWTFFILLAFCLFLILCSYGFCVFVCMRVSQCVCLLCFLLSFKKFWFTFFYFNLPVCFLKKEKEGTGLAG